MKHCPRWLFVLAGGICVTAGAAPVPEQLADAVKIPDFDLAAIGDRRAVELPPLPRKAGLIPVIRMKMYAEAPKAAGCFRCVELTFNETPLGRFAGTQERLLGRHVTFQLPNHPGREFPVFSGGRVMLTDRTRRAPTPSPPTGTRRNSVSGSTTRRGIRAAIR